MTEDQYEAATTLAVVRAAKGVLRGHNSNDEMANNQLRTIACLLSKVEATLDRQVHEAIYNEDAPNAT